jgi:hypothetical protein
MLYKSAWPGECEGSNGREESESDNDVGRRRKRRAQGGKKGRKRSGLPMDWTRREFNGCSPGFRGWWVESLRAEGYL